MLELEILPRFSGHCLAHSKAWGPRRSAHGAIPDAVLASTIWSCGRPSGGGCGAPQHQQMKTINNDKDGVSCIPIKHKFEKAAEKQEMKRSLQGALPTGDLFYG